MMNVVCPTTTLCAQQQHCVPNNNVVCPTTTLCAQQQRCMPNNNVVCPTTTLYAQRQRCMPINDVVCPTTTLCAQQQRCVPNNVRALSLSTYICVHFNQFKAVTICSLSDVIELGKYRLSISLLLRPRPTLLRIS